jgi:hypothetical protein
LEGVAKDDEFDATLGAARLRDCADRGRLEVAAPGRRETSHLVISLSISWKAYKGSTHLSLLHWLVVIASCRCSHLTRQQILSETAGSSHRQGAPSWAALTDSIVAAALGFVRSDSSETGKKETYLDGQAENGLAHLVDRVIGPSVLVSGISDE